MKIAVIGTGYVGLVTGAGLSEFGTKVTCIDIDEKKIQFLKEGGIPIYEPGLESLVKRNVRAERLTFTTDFENGVKDARTVFIAVGTPEHGDGSANLDYVFKAVEDVAKVWKKYPKDYRVLAVKSTVPVGTGAKVRDIIRKVVGEAVEFGVASNPEFLREGSAVRDFMHPDRVVIGGDDERTIEVMKHLYHPLYLIETPFVETDLQTSELIKYAANAFLATKISFINEVANYCDKVNADVNKVARGIGLDGRIGPKFLHAGPGYGGSCFPKDLKSLAHMGKVAKSPFRVTEAVIEVNARQKDRMVEKIETLSGGLKGKTAAILGLAFKPNTDDIRESPAVYIAQKLIERGAIVRAFDPEAMENTKKILPGLIYTESAYEAAQGADILILATEWNQFRNLDLGELKQRMAAPVIADLRNIYDPEEIRDAGFRYVGVGRGSA